MAANEIHVGDIGTAFIGTVKDAGGNIIDLSGASTLTITFEKPDASTTAKTGSLVTDGTDGKMQYATAAASDLDQSGQWRWQGRVVLAGGTWHTDIHVFEVHANL